MSTANESSVSQPTPEITRRNAARIQGEILRRLAEVTQEGAAECIGVDASTVSRWKPSLDDACKLIAALGLQIAPPDCMVVTRAEYMAYKTLTFKSMQMEMQGQNWANWCGGVFPA